MSKIRIRAAAVQAAARGRPVLVFAAHKDDAVDLVKLEKTVTSGSYAKHSCANCGTHSLVTSALKTPMCVTCGVPAKASAKIGTLSSNIKIEIKAGSLSALVCAHCETVNVLPRNVIAATAKSKTPIHCSACGQGVQANAEDDTDSGETLKLDSDKLTNQDLKKPVAAEADDTFGRDDISEVEDTVLGEGDDLDDLDDIQSRNVFASLMDDDGANGAQGEESDDQTADFDDSMEDPLSDPIVPVDDDFEMDDGFGLTAAAEDGDEDGDKDEVEADATPQLEGTGEYDTGLNLNPDGSFAMDAPAKTGQNLRELVPNDRIGDAGTDDFGCDMPVYAGEGEALFECAGFDDTAKAVSFVTIGKRLVAMKGHTAVAVLQPHRARENASIMHGEAFAEAVVRVAAKSGLQKALAHFRFDAIKVPSIATSRTERQIAAFQAQAGAKMQKMQKEQASCFAMAAAGLAKGKFKGVENALAKGLMTEFARLGVRNPKAIVSAVLTKHGMEYAKQLVLTASKLGNLTEAARKETADMLDLVTEEDMNLSGPDFTTAETEDTLDKDDDGDVDGDDFKEESDFGDDLETEDYAVASLLRPARQHASRVHASYGEPDAAAMAREILSGRRSMFAG